MKRIAIIPARSGSKGLPDKNIKVFNGMPLMAWSIKAARDSGMFDEIMVSTDSEQYKDIAIKYGANVPFLRSSDKASDTASSWDTVKEVLNNYNEQLGLIYDDFCLLQPTSPLRTAEDIKKAYNVFEEKKADSVVSVCELEHSIKSINKIPQSGSLDGFYDSRENARRQDADKYYRLNGAIYIQKVKSLFDGCNLYGEKSYSFIMSKGHSLDIDDEYDFIMAEAVARAK